MSDAVEYRMLSALWPGYRVGSDGSVWCWWKKGQSGGNRRMRWKDGRIDWKEKKQTKSKRQYAEYFVVTLTRRGVSETVCVHSLVLLAFHGQKPFPTALCRHINGNHLDNRASNVCWGTYQENSNDMVRHGTSPKGERSGAAKLNEGDVVLIRRRVLEGEGMESLAVRLGVSEATIADVFFRRSWKHI